MRGRKYIITVVKVKVPPLIHLFNNKAPVASCGFGDNFCEKINSGIRNFPRTVKLVKVHA